jgi:NADH dehydrogenase
VWKPLLHEIAAATLPATDCEVDYIQHAFQHHFRFEYGEVVDIDREAHLIQLDTIVDAHGVVAPARLMPYDWLVIALGSSTNTFDTPGVAQYAAMLNDTEDAEALRAALLRQIHRIQLSMQDSISVAIVGGGATGVEFAAELHEMARELRLYGAEFGPHKLQTTIIDAGARVLPTSPLDVSERAAAVLSERSIRIVVNRRVERIGEAGATLDDGTTVAADLVVWASGIKAPSFLGELGLRTNKLNQVVVDSSLQSLTDDRVYAIGDCASYTPGDTQRPLPATAQVAHQQALYLARALRERLEGRPPKSFRFRDKGSLVSLGTKNAVGYLAGGKPTSHGSVSLHGAGAKMLYVALYWFHQRALHGWLKTARLFVIDKLRNVRRFGVKVY